MFSTGSFGVINEKKKSIAKKISSLRQDMPRRSQRRRSRRQRKSSRRSSGRRALSKKRLKELSNKRTICGGSRNERLGVLSRSAIDGMSAAQQSAFFEYLYTGFVVNTWLQGMKNPLDPLPADYEDMSAAHWPGQGFALQITRSRRELEFITTGVFRKEIRLES